MLRKIRIVVSVLFAGLLGFFLLDFAELLPRQLHALAEIQLVPALLALNGGILIALLVLTFVFGRVYCSSVCPLGVYQDLVGWLHRKVNEAQRKRFVKQTANAKQAATSGANSVSTGAAIGTATAASATNTTAYPNVAGNDRTADTATSAAGNSTTAGSANKAAASSAASAKQPRWKRYQYKYLQPMTWLRWSFLTATVIAFVFGFSFLVGLLDPYSIFARFMVNVLKPVYETGNNVLADVMTSAGNHSFYRIGVYVLSLSSVIIAVVTMAVVTVLSWRNGRIYCNTVCPVGTLLGTVSRYSLYQIRFDTEKCNLCGTCARNCKASCIDFKNMTVDASRCINCFNCIEVCSESGLKYRLPYRKISDAVPVAAAPTAFTAPGSSSFSATPKDSSGTKSSEPLNFTQAKDVFATATSATSTAANQTNMVTPVVATTTTPSATSTAAIKAINPIAMDSRRRFLSVLGLSALAASTLMADTVLSLGPVKAVSRKQPIMPPGAMNIEKFARQCTSCHLCVAKCPAQIIKPSLFEYGISGIMQPMLDFQHQFCNYDCTICTDVCPTDALTRLTQEEKNHMQMGVVQLYLENCIVYTDETSCGACSEHCPTQAVHMVPYKGHLTIPEIRTEICVGCGGCEFICPAIPHKAIFVEGITQHKRIELVKDEVKEYEIDDFGF